MAEETEVLEKGSIYFIYRPKVGEFNPQGVEDIQRFYMVLDPNEANLFRLVVIAEKKLPEGEGDNRKYWGYVEEIANTPEQVREEFEGRVYATKTVGERGQPSGRPVGEGVYALVSHKDHTHLVYSLTVPEKLGEVQQELNIKQEGNYIVSVINPVTPAPKDVNVDREQRAEYPKDLQALFEGHRFIKLKTPKLLDYPGASMLIISVEKDVSKELGVELEPSIEDREAVNIFRNLRLEASTHTITPLLAGEWA